MEKTADRSPETELNLDEFRVDYDRALRLRPNQSLVYCILCILYTVYKYKSSPWLSVCCL